MIYEAVEPDAPIRQGDIFTGVPRVNVSLRDLPVAGELHDETRPWREIAAEGKPALVTLPVSPVRAIVITQDCDVVRASDISLCEIVPFVVTERIARDTKSPKSWMNIITQHAKKNLKWFYLPPDNSLVSVEPGGTRCIST